MTKQVSDRWFAAVLTCVYFLVELAQILHHGMWRDELQVWMIARHSLSISDLIYLKRYEGQPDAWYFLVYLLTRVTANPVSMQLLHLAIATTTVYFIAEWAPFTRLEKTLLVFGYFLIFEYAAISREYALGVLCVVVFCTMFRSTLRKHHILIAMPLALLIQTSVYGVMIATALTLAALYEILSSPEERRSLHSNASEFTFAAALLLGSLFLSARHSVPPPGDRFDVPLHFPYRHFQMTLAMVWDTFVPIPKLSRQFWNTNFVDWPVGGSLSIPLIGITALFFLRKPSALLAYSCGLGAMLVFKHVKYPGHIRNDGHLFILFIACCWLALDFADVQFPVAWLDSIGKRFERHRGRVFVCLLAIQTAVGLAVTVVAFGAPFSQARSTAQFLSSQGMGKIFIVGYRDENVSSVGAYLDRDIYYVGANRMGSFIDWSSKDSKQEPFALATAEASKQHENVLVILTSRPSVVPSSFREIASFDGAIVYDENFHVYLSSP